MSLKLKLGLLIVAIAVLLSGLLWVFTQNQQQLADIATKRRLGQVMVFTSNKLALGKSLLQSDLPDKTGIIKQLQDDIFLMRTAINIVVKIEDHPETIPVLRDLQLELSTVSLLLEDFQLRLAGGEALTQADILQLNQLDGIVSEFAVVVKEYERHLRESAEQVTATTRLYTSIVIFAMVSMVIVISLVSYFNILRPINALVESAAEISRGNYEHRTDIRSRDEFGQLGGDFNDMAAELQATLGRLDQRARQVETSTEVSRQLSTILDPTQLVSEVVDQVQRAFNYYHVHIYMFDSVGEDLVMAGGTGQVGRTLLNKRHKISRGQGLVGRAAATNSVVLASDVSQEKGWLPNPLLPDTKSEIAVPIAVAERVLGVLDVQQNTIGGLTGEDARLLQTVANQVAVALHNAGLFEQTQKQADRETMLNLIGQSIQTAPDIESVLRIAARELGQALGAERTSVQLSNPGGPISARPSNGARPSDGGRSPAEKLT